jgi:alpha-glucosidase
MRKIFLVLCLLWAPALMAATVSSPDGRIELEVSAQQGMAQYQVRFNGTTVIASSRLGLTFAELATLGDGVKLGEVKLQHKHEPWEQPWGEQRHIENRYQQLTAAFINESGREVFTLEVRVFNDGLGFRYHVPELIDGPVSLIDELTQFVLPDAPRTDAWWIPAREWNRYEYLYEQTKADAMRLVHTPVTFRQTNGVHLSIHEAALLDYAAMSLKQERTGVLKADLAPWSDGRLVKTLLPLSTPWRTVQIADSATGLLNSALSLNLNEPNVLGDVTWVHPGKYIGIWWGMHINKNTWGSGPIHGATTSEAKRYIDFAEKHGFDGVLIEGWNIGWDGDWFFNGEVFSFTEAYPDFDIKAVTDYARERGVRLIGHHETSGNVTNYEAQMKDAFALYQSVGVTQVKTGYVADGGDIVRHTAEGFKRHEWHDGQYMVNHYLHNVRTAAEHQISINTHEPVKDTGLRRTYPNWISREGARGQEFNAWGSPPNPPNHIPTLAYTRLLAGPMDFTPGIVDMTFNGLDGWNRPQTTVAKQLASYVVIYSPIQMAADLPENYQQHPVALEYIESVVTDWEQSIALAGEVGEFVVQARQERGGERWFVGGMTNENSRSLALPLSFLSDDQKYTLTVYRDAPATDWRTNPAELIKESFTVTRGSILNINMVASGGFAAILTPQ